MTASTFAWCCCCSRIMANGVDVLYVFARARSLSSEDICEALRVSFDQDRFDICRRDEDGEVDQEDFLNIAFPLLIEHTAAHLKASSYVRGQLQNQWEDLMEEEFDDPGDPKFPRYRSKDQVQKILMTVYADHIIQREVLDKGLTERSHVKDSLRTSGVPEAVIERGSYKTYYDNALASYAIKKATSEISEENKGKQFPWSSEECDIRSKLRAIKILQDMSEETKGAQRRVEVLFKPPRKRSRGAGYIIHTQEMQRMEKKAHAETKTELGQAKTERDAIKAARDAEIAAHESTKKLRDAYKTDLDKEKTAHQKTKSMVASLLEQLYKDLIDFEDEEKFLATVNDVASAVDLSGRQLWDHFDRAESLADRMKAKKELAESAVALMDSIDATKTKRGVDDAVVKRLEDSLNKLRAGPAPVAL